MITINTTTKEVVFSRNKHTEAERRCPLVCGHVCPHCGLVLSAGFLTDEPVPVHLYEEPPVLRMECSRYDTNFARHPGSQLIARNERARGDIRMGRASDDGCPYLAFTHNDLTFNVRLLLFEELHVNVPIEDIEVSQRPRDLPGLLVVEDFCGRFSPVLLVDPDALAGGCWNFKRERWEAYWGRRTKALEGLRRCVAKQPTGSPLRLYGGR